MPTSEAPELAHEPLNCRVACRSCNASRGATVTDDERRAVHERIEARKARAARLYTVQTRGCPHDRSTLTDELVDGYIAANLATAHKRAKTRRFLATQLDPTNQANTHNLADALRGVEAPTLILWGERDVHFPPSWARRLAADIPATTRVEILPATGHLLMEEHPNHVAAQIGEFLTTTKRSGAQGGA
jgi:pimeloyl-ACP methyl ester carboxylesterase